MDYFLPVLFIVTCLLLILVVLLQKGRGGGLGAAFGGAPGGGAFGTRTGDVLTWVTIGLTAVYLVLAVGTALYFQKPSGTVAMPVFVPMPKAIDTPTVVEMRCSIKGAKIYFTTDGNDPTESSHPYLTPITINPGTTLKARSFRAGWSASPVSTGIYPVVGAETAPATQTAPAESVLPAEPH